MYQTGICDGMLSDIGTTFASWRHDLPSRLLSRIKESQKETEARNMEELMSNYGLMSALMAKASQEAADR